MNYDITIPNYDVKMVSLSAGQVRDWGHMYLKAQEYYGVSRGEGAVVFILDTAGTFMDHPDLAPNCLPEYDDNATNSPDQDAHGHGTHCAGISCAVDNQVGVIGIAPGAKLVARKVLNDSGSGSFNWVADQIRKVADIPDTGKIKGLKRIISMSLGGPAGQSAPQVLKDAIDYAIGKGCFIVAAAGNSGYSGGRSTVGAPANYLPVIAVASTNRPGTVRSSFSSGGAEVDLTAPGGSIYSTHKGGGYARLSGTSMACPQVAGVMALVLSANPEITSQAQLVNFLAGGAADLFSPGKDDESGYGSPVLDGYKDKDPGDGPSDPPVNPDPPTDPEPPTIPRRPDVVATEFPHSGGVHKLVWRPEDERGMRDLLVSKLDCEVVSDVTTPALAPIVNDYVLDWFKSRGMVIKADQDVRDALVWCAAFLQFNADDDRVFEKWGVRLDLTVTAIETHVGRIPIRITQDEIAARVRDIKHGTSTVAQMTAA